MQKIFTEKWLALHRCAFVLLLSSAVLVPGRCPAQGSDTPAAGQGTVQNSPQTGKQPGQQPQPQSKNSQTRGQPARKSTVEKVETSVGAGVNRISDLPAEWFLGAYVPANRNLRPLSNEERRQVYVRQTYLTGASYLKRLFAAGIDQARGVPPEWDEGSAGYGSRFASRYGQFIIQNTLTSAGDAALRYEPRYDLCRCTGFGPRTRHAVLRNFVTYNQTESEQRPQIALYIGAFGAGALATTWKPPNQSPWRNGAYAALGQAGYGAISNWLQEFALDIGHKLSRRKMHP